MEMTHQGGAEAESLLRPDQRSAVVMPGQRTGRWNVYGEKAPFIRNEPVDQTPAWEGNLPNDSHHLKGPSPGWNVDGEKAPFLRNEPVKLTPAWEGTNLPNDSLNLKGIAMDLAPPKDKWNLIFFTLMLHGLGTLTAWNMFITAKDYFVKYKLKDAPEYSENYLPYVGWASQTPNLLFSWFNIFVKIGGNLTTRIVWSLCIEVGIFVFTVVLAMVDSSAWPELFFWLTMISVFLLNGFNAIFQNSVYGVAARLPPKYTGAVVLGSNICGTLVVFLSWASELFDSIRTSAIYYFIGGMFVLLICFDTYFALPLNRFYRYHDTLQQRTMRVNPALAATNPTAGDKSRTPYGTILAQSWVQLYNIFIIFFVTLSVFPTVHSDIEPSSSSYLGGFLGQKFVPITCFFTFNFTAMIGNITASLWQFPKPRWLVLFTTLRILFVPFFLFCNYKPAMRSLPVLVSNDWVYWAAAALLGWSSGHGSSLGMMYVSGTVAPEHASIAGMIGGATLVTGIVFGITFSRFSPIIVNLDLWRGI